MGKMIAHETKVLTSRQADKTSYLTDIGCLGSSQQATLKQNFLLKFNGNLLIYFLLDKRKIN